MEMLTLNNNKSKHAKIHFIISSVIIVVLLIVIPLVTVYLLSTAYDEQIRLEAERNTSSIQRTVRTFIDGAYNLSFELSDNPAVLSLEPDVVVPILVNCAQRNPYMELIYVTGMDGMQIARSSGELGDRSERFWFLQMMETGQPFVSKSYYSVSTALPCASIFIPMYAGNEMIGSTEMIGIYGVDISLEYLQSLVEQFTNIENGRYAFIIDGEGVVIAHHDSYILETLTNYKTQTRTVPMLDAAGNIQTNPNGSVITTEQPFTTSAGFKAIIDSVMYGNSGLELVSFDDNTYYMSYEPIPLPGYSDSWSIVTLYDRSIAMGVVTRLVTQEILVVVSIIIVFIALIVTFFKSLSRTLDFLENARREADHANKSKSDFLATMSHEIRTPLNAIIGLAQVQLQEKDMPRENFEAMEKIYSSGNSLLKIINDILDLSKVETGVLNLSPEVYDIPSMINDTVQLNIVRIGHKKIDFTLKVNENLPSKVLGDGLRVKQILNNLISNAIKYTDEGFINLTVGHTIDGDNVTLYFRVEDSGAGIAYEDQKWLFSEYTRFNAHDDMFTEGTGLGLTITKKLAEMMGGKITVRSLHGKGSEFTVTVMQKAVDCRPIGPDVADRLQRFTFVDDSHALSQIDYTDLHDGHVMVVDDVDINLYVAEAVLKPYNLNVDLVTGGLEAITNIKNGKTYDIIFMDHMMPEMDGIETTEELRKMDYNGAIIALTANALVGNEEMFSQHGFDGFIPKPIDIHDLDIVINKFVKKSD